MVRALALLAAALVLAGCGEREEPATPAAPPPRQGVWAVGDAAVPGDEGRPLARLVDAAGPERLLYLGDVYESGTLDEFRSNYDPLYGALADRTVPVAGNHEHENRRSGYDVYWREKTGRPPRPWHAVRENGWELIALDSELPHDAGSPQVRWLRGHLARAPRTTCRIAFWHRPRFSAGEHHGDQPDTAPLWDALRGHAVAVLGGHDHNLQRLRPVDGIVQFVSGAGGRELYPVDEDDDRVAFADDERLGALRIVLRAGAMGWSFVAADGSVLDEGTLRCRRR